MKLRIYGLSAGLIACVVSPAAAQLPATVQLPSYSYFGVDTSVSVPDRGSMSLGGVGRASAGSNAFGPVLGPSSRSFGRQMGASSATVHATIHDFEAMDRLLLNQAGSSYGSLPRRRTSRGELSSAATGPAGSVAEARRLHAADLAAQTREAKKYMDQAERAAARGKPQVARVIYQMAERRATGELKAEIRERLVALKPAAK